MHVTIRASDAAASERFYDVVFEPLGIAATRRHAREGVIAWDDFALVRAAPGEAATRHRHVGFVALRATTPPMCSTRTERTSSR
jgi:catechol 2,3-dioxygenase-like lactoylglutathione lyase family enzyme